MLVLIARVVLLLTAFLLLQTSEIAQARPDNTKYLTENALKLAKKKGMPVITFDSDLLPEHQEYRLAYVTRPADHAVVARQVQQHSSPCPQT